VKKRYFPGRPGGPVRGGGGSSAGSVLLALLLIPLSLVLLLVGAGLLALLVLDSVVPTQAKPDPHTLTCRELMDLGPGDNTHVLLTDFQLDTSHVVITTEKDGPRRETYWVALFPADGAIDPGKLRLLLKTDRLASRTELRQLARETQLQGIVLRHEAPTESEPGGRLLRDAYPGADLRNCLVLVHRATGSRVSEPPPAVVVAPVGVGLLLLGAAAGLLWWLLDRRRARRLAAARAG
jgi:hypothetical protein